jgi:hypothetical protein
MRQILLIAMAILISTPLWAFEPYELTADMANAVKAKIAKQLNNPDGAKFGEMVSVKKPDGTIIVCGTVYAKDPFGGYSGPSPFVGETREGSTGFVIDTLAEDAAGMAQVIALCQNAGAMPSDL